MPETANQAVERKIRQISLRIVRGMRCVDRPEIRYFRWYHLSTVAMSSLASIGIGHPALELLRGQKQAEGTLAALTGFTGWALFGGAVALAVLAILKGLYTHYNVDAIARDALAANNAFRRVLEELRNVLDVSDPMPRLLELQERSNALAVHYSAILPDGSSTEVRSESASLTKNLVDTHVLNWSLPELTGGQAA